MTCQCRFIDHILWFRMPVVGEVLCVEPRGLWELFVLSAQLFCEPETALKKIKFISWKNRLIIETECFSLEVSRVTSGLISLPKTSYMAAPHFRQAPKCNSTQCLERESQAVHKSPSTSWANVAYHDSWYKFLYQSELLVAINSVDLSRKGIY